jgi:uncharacterized protein (DUF58 family)
LARILSNKSFKMLKFPCKQTKTKLKGPGILFFTFVVLIGAIAVNSGNNLVYLTFSTVLSFLVLSGMLSLQNLRKIEVELKFPEMVFAETNIPFSVRIRNKFWLEKFLITAEVLNKKINFDYIGEEAIKTAWTQFKYRGKTEIKYVQLSSTFPFNFFVRNKEIQVNKDIIIYPPLKEVFVKYTSINKAEENQFIKKSGEEFYSIKEYRNGENSKLINWKATAKTGKLMMTENVSPSGNKVVIQFDNSRYLYKNKEEFEQAVIKINALVYKCFTEGKEVSLISEIAFPFANSKAHYKNIFTFIATISEKDVLPKRKIHGAITPNDISYA